MPQSQSSTNGFLAQPPWSGFTLGAAAAITMPATQTSEIGR